MIAVSRNQFGILHDDTKKPAPGLTGRAWVGLGLGLVGFGEDVSKRPTLAVFQEPFLFESLKVVEVVVWDLLSGWVLEVFKSGFLKFSELGGGCVGD